MIAQRPMPPDLAAEQAEHDRRHPGLICQHCPSERWHVQWLQDRHDYYMVRLARARRRRILLGLLLLAAFLWGCLAPWPHIGWP